MSRWFLYCRYNPAVGNFGGDQHRCLFQVRRGFLTPDPLVSPVGAGWSSNVYAFAGFDPVSLVDPWGLSPVSRADFAVYAKEHPSPTLKGWANEHADTIAKVAIVAGAALTIAGIIATGSVGMIALGIAGGAALAGGMSILGNKNSDGTVNWGKVGIDTLVGGALGAIGGAGNAATKATMAITKNATRFGGSVAVNAGINGTTGAIGGAGTYGVQVATGKKKWSTREFLGNTVSSGFTAAVGGLAGPGSGTLFKSAGPIVSRLGKEGVEASINFGAGVAGEGVNSYISGEDTNLRKLAGSGAMNMGTGLIHTHEPVNANTLNQATYTTPSTLKGAFYGVQSQRMWTGGFQGAGLGSFSDLAIGDLVKGE